MITQPTNGMCERIRIRLRKAYFHGRHVDLMWKGDKDEDKKTIVHHSFGILKRL
jgi:hypothetical protein